MNHFGISTLISASIFLTANPTSAFAGWQEGLAAYEREDFSTAIKEMMPLAEQGNIDAQVKLGESFDQTKNYKEGLFWYKKAADGGSAIAQKGVAFHYSVGWGVATDDKVAFYWYKKSAENGGDSIGVANRYRDGVGVKKDYKKAVSWYKKDAEQGDVTACYMLGVMYGKSYLSDYKQAVYWYQRAAEKGDEGASYHLAEEFREHKDIKQAKIWYEKTIQLHGYNFGDSARAKLVEIEDGQHR